MKDKKLKKYLQNNDELVSKIADLFSLFADYTRCRILSALSDKPMNVSTIALHLNMNTSAVSHSLRILKTAGVVKCVRSGREITYFLQDEHIFEIFIKAKEHIEKC